MIRKEVETSKERNKQLDIYVNGIASSLRANCYEVYTAVSHNKPFYVSLPPIIMTTNHISSESEALRLVKDALYIAGYHVDKYNFSVEPVYSNIYPDKIINYLTTITVNEEQRKKNLEQRLENARRGVREAEEQLRKAQENLDNVEDYIKRHRQDNAY